MTGRIDLDLAIGGFVFFVCRNPCGSVVAGQLVATLRSMKLDATRHE